MSLAAPRSTGQKSFRCNDGDADGRDGLIAREATVDRRHAAAALLLTLIGSALIGAQQTRDLRDVEQRLVPKLELGPKLQTEFDHLRQGMQDAVAAQDAPALEATLADRNRIFELIAAGSRGVLDPSDAAMLRWTIHDYYEAAQDVSQRLISGDTGEGLVDRMARMQAQQAKVDELIKKTTGLSRGELKASFASVESASQRADRFRLGIGLCGLALVLALSLSVTKGVFRGLRVLSVGLSRFATGDFKEQLPSSGLSELAKLAREANQMASNLQKLGEERDRADWLKESQALLSNEMRGDSEPGAPRQPGGALLGASHRRCRRGAVFVGRRRSPPARALWHRRSRGLHRAGPASERDPGRGGC